MTIDEFCSKYDLSKYRVAQLIDTQKKTLYHWAIGRRRYPTWINKYLDLQDYYYSQNGKFLE